MIKIIEKTDKPITLMGKVASICWGKDPSIDIGFKVLEANHGRALEYPSVTIEISRYSARLIRELYTHIIGVSRLQESTRYIDYNDFNYYMPDNLLTNPGQVKVYLDAMKLLQSAYQSLLILGVSKEDAANILPLGMHSKVILKINLRAILHMFEERTCERAYKEFQTFMKELKSVLSDIDQEWKCILDNYAETKCEIVGYCREIKSCGKFSKKGK